MSTDFYKEKAEEILSNLETTNAEFAKVINDNNLRDLKKSHESITAEFNALFSGTRDIDNPTSKNKIIYSEKFINLKDDFISLVYAFDKEMPFYTKMMSEQVPCFSSFSIVDKYEEDCDKLKSYINKFIYYLSFYQNQHRI